MLLDFQRKRAKGDRFISKVHRISIIEKV